MGVLLGVLSIAASFVIYYLQREDNIRLETATYYFTAGDKGELGDVKNLEKADCWINSIASNRSDAYRCMVTSTTYDPCFINPFDYQSIVCPMDVSGGNKYFGVDSTEKIFNQRGERDSYIDKFPWYIKLSDDTECKFLTGGTNVIAGMRIDYACDGDSNIAYLLLPLTQEDSLLRIGCYKDKDYKIAYCDIKEAWY